MVGTRNGTVPNHNQHTHVRFPLRTTSVVVHNRPALNRAHHHLTPADLQNLHDSPFDINWLSKYRIDPSVLKTSTAKHKLENIILHGALVQMDAFCIFDKGQTVGLAPRLCVISAVPCRGRRYPIVTIHGTGPIGGLLVHDIECKGLTDLLEHFDDLHPATEMNLKRNIWPIIKFKRLDPPGSHNYRYIGSLWEIRQIFAYYQMLMDGWVGVQGKNSKVLATRPLGYITMWKKRNAAARAAAAAAGEDHDDSDDEDQDDTDDEQQDEMEMDD
ncbi:MAG: hypothetical protein Q9212_003210 [Teloschistes hypoglaucus]